MKPNIEVEGGGGVILTKVKGLTVTSTCPNCQKKVTLERTVVFEGPQWTSPLCMNCEDCIDRDGDNLLWRTWVRYDFPTMRVIPTKPPEGESDREFISRGWF